MWNHVLIDFLHFVPFSRTCVASNQTLSMASPPEQTIKSQPSQSTTVKQEFSVTAKQEDESYEQFYSEVKSRYREWLIRSDCFSQVKAIEKRDSVLTSEQQIDRLLRPGATYFNLNPFEVGRARKLLLFLFHERDAFPFSIGSTNRSDDTLWRSSQTLPTCKTIFCSMILSSLSIFF